MVRPLRIEFAGGLYHITSRGSRKEAIIYYSYNSGMYSMKEIGKYFGFITQELAELLNNSMNGNKRQKASSDPFSC